MNKSVAIKCIDYAEKYLTNKEGLCLSSSAELYLGDIGALSKDEAKKVFPILEKASENAEVNEVDWILEAYMKMVNNLEEDEKNKIRQYANKNTDAPKKSTQKRVRKLLKLL